MRITKQQVYSVLDDEVWRTCAEVVKTLREGKSKGKHADAVIQNVTALKVYSILVPLCVEGYLLTEQRRVKDKDSLFYTEAVYRHNPEKPWNPDTKESDDLESRVA